MAKVPFTEEQALKLVENGHLSEATYNHLKTSGGFMQGFDEGGVVAPEMPAAPVDNTSNLVGEKAAYYQAQGMSMGDAMAKAAMDIQGAKNAAASAAMAPQQGFDQSMAALPKTPEEAAQMEALGGKPGIASPATMPLQGAQVASNAPANDIATAAGMIPQASHPEAGRVDPSQLVMPTSAQPQAPAAADPIKPFTDAMAQQTKGLEMAGQAGAKKAAQEAGFYNEAQKQLRMQQAHEHVAEMQRQDEMAAGMQKLETAMHEAANGKIDPNHFWNSRTTGQKVMAAIALALGGIGGGISGKGGNVGFDIINHAIDRDIEAQKSNLAQKNQAVQNQTGLYNMMRQRFGDERQAYLATRAAYLQNVEMQVHEIAARNDSAIIQGNAQAMLGQVKMQQEQIKAQMAESLGQKALLKQLSGGDATQITGAQLANMPKEIKENFVQGEGIKGIAHGTKGAEQMREQIGTVGQAKAQINRLIEIGKDNGRSFTPSQAKAEAEVIVGMLQGILRTPIVGPGAVSESERALIKSVIANPTEIFQLNSVHKLEALKDILTKGLHFNAKANGLSVAGSGINFTRAQ